MQREPGGIWRKKRGGREYGSFYTYAGKRIVNLGTDLVEDARRKARELLTGGPAEKSGGVYPAPSGVPSAGPPTNGSSVLHRWAEGSAGAGAVPGATTSPGAAPVGGAPPLASPALTEAMRGLAEGLATAVAQMNCVAVSLGVRYVAHVHPPKVDPDNLKALEKTWATGLQELMLLHGLQWWHILLAQNGALAMQLYRDGTPIPPKVMAPVQPA